MKICDGADWFSETFSATIRNELHEVPRFHRKQWEFAAILNALSSAGALNPSAKGISFGAGQVLPIYALANRVATIWATDLYTADSAWPTARPDTADATTEYVRSGSHFSTQAERIFAKSMDMRTIDFPDDHFDFAYSSSADEHIGGWQDFAQQLSEVRRVLKPGGIYVMTTDISFGPPTECPGNFKFDPAGLEWWLQNSGMQYEPIVDCRIAEHYINTPLPADLACYITPDKGRIHHNLFGMLTMAHNLTGCHPHTSVLLQMRKAPPRADKVEFTGYAESMDFLLRARQSLQLILEEADLFPAPAPWMPENLLTERWATTYMWLGAKSRAAKVRIVTDGTGQVTFGVNKCHSDQYWVPEVHMVEDIYPVTNTIELLVPLHLDAKYTYALHGRTIGDVALRHVSVQIADSRTFTPIPGIILT
jgi:SAM-dependent methyltransferase